MTKTNTTIGKLIRLAANKLGAEVRASDNTEYVYYADEISMYCVSSEADMVKLGQMLQDSADHECDDECERHGQCPTPIGDEYSHWCSATSAETFNNDPNDR